MVVARDGSERGSHIWMYARTWENEQGRGQRSQRRRTGLISVAAVRFGPVQRPIFPNPGLDLGFGSAKLLNLGLDLRFRFSEVRFRFRGDSDGFEPIFVSHGPNHLKKYLQPEFTTKETTHPPIYPSIPPSQRTLASFGLLWV